MNREDLYDSVVAARPGGDDTVYVERRGDDYAWELLSPGEVTMPPSAVGGETPDVWLYFSGSWPLDDPAKLRAFYDDLLAEMESMAGGADRCRWPLDQPWPHTH